MKQLTFIDLIPVLGFLFAKGKCRHCGKSISFQYPIVESLTALIISLLYLKFSFGLDFFAYVVLSLFLIVVAFIDFNTQEVHDSVTVSGSACGMVFSFYRNNFYDSFVGAAFGFCALFLLGKAAKFFYKKEAIGDGDAMIFLLLGAFLGIKGVVATFFLSFFIGGMIGLFLLLFRLKKIGEAISFGPIIVIGAFAYVFFGEKIIDFYFSFLGFI